VSNKSRRSVKRCLFERGVPPFYKWEPSPRYQRDCNNSKTVSPETVLQRHLPKCQISGPPEERQRKKLVFLSDLVDISGE
jgi:hypothetical protein